MRPRALTRYEKYLKVLGIFFDSESATKIDAVSKSEKAIFVSDTVSDEKLAGITNLPELFIKTYRKQS